MADTKSSTLKAKRTQYGAYLTLYTLIILAVLVVLNWLANQNNKSFDTTSNKLYTLSDQTIKTVKNLKNNVYVTYFDRASHFSTARDLLDRYANLSHKLQVAYVDPEKQPDVAAADGFRTEGGIVVRNGVKTEESAAVTEEGVTNAIIRSTKTGQKTVCFASGSGEAALDDQDSGGASFAKEQLEKNTYKTSTISLLEKQQVPAECAVVVIGGPKKDYFDAAVTALKSYVDGGGHVMLSLGPALGSSRGGASQGEPATNLMKMAADWGVTFDNDLVLDPQSRLVGFSEAAPLGIKYESQPIVRDLGRIATLFPIAQSLTVASGKSAEKLISTSDSAVSIPKPAGGNVSVDPSTAKKGPFVLAAVGTVGTGAKQGRYMVVGSSLWLANQALSIQQLGNRDLFLNAVNWLSADEDLISIRPKDPEDRRISMTNNQMRILFFSTVVFLPLLAIISGVAVWAKRR
jgi:ABC-type uncharacterized transport system involved in gliding motility auxiliary subunit